MEKYNDGKGKNIIQRAKDKSNSALAKILLTGALTLGSGCATIGVNQVSYKNPSYEVTSGSDYDFGVMDNDEIDHYLKNFGEYRTLVCYDELKDDNGDLIGEIPTAILWDPSGINDYSVQGSDLKLKGTELEFKPKDGKEFEYEFKQGESCWREITEKSDLEDVVKEMKSIYKIPKKSVRHVVIEGAQCDNGPGFYNRELSVGRMLTKASDLYLNMRRDVDDPYKIKLGCIGLEHIENGEDHWSGDGGGSGGNGGGSGGGFGGAGGGSV